MSEHDETLRGSTPIYTAKDILVRLDDKVEKMDLKIDGMQTAIQILVSQNLNERVLRLESTGSHAAQEALRLARSHQSIMEQVKGASIVLKVLVGGNLLSVVMAALALVNSGSIRL